MARVSDDFKGFGALVNEIGKRIKFLSYSYSMQLALISELLSLKNVAVSETSTSVTDAFTRQTECFNKVGSSVLTEFSTKTWRLLHSSTETEGKEQYLYSTMYTTHSIKVLRHGSHSFTCKLHHACLSFVSVHQMAPPLTEVADIQLQLTTYLSTPKG